MPKPNYVENDTVPDVNNPGYSQFRAHVFGGPALTFFGASTPLPDAHLTRIGLSLNNSRVQEELSNRLEKVAQEQETQEALEEILPDDLISMINRY
ncbi:MAG: hypothetical protein ACRCXC_02755 [Legionella sp.]